MFKSELRVGAHPALFTDQYQLTMAAAYFEEGLFEPATFSFFIRKYPRGRGYFVAAGMHDVLDYLQHFRFSEEDVAYLRKTGLYPSGFLAQLPELRFSGDVHALAEGTLAFTDEPLLEITAPIIEAQLVETYVINRLQLQTMLATKAARCVWAAAGRPVIDFSLRRTHGTDAGMQAARCGFLAGTAGTSNVLAGMHWGIPTFGTMAHSYVESFEEEAAAFRAFARVFPNASTFLTDTYDTLGGVRAAIQVAKEMQRAGNAPPGIRLDSGDLDSLSRAARKLLDDAGLTNVRILASGGLDEYEIETLVRGGAPIDAFGVGTSMGVSGDAPWLECAYKLVEYAGRGCIKLSTGKTNWVGRKQVWRCIKDGCARGDCLALREESSAEIARVLGESSPECLEPLLQPLMKNGRLLAETPPLAEIRARVHSQLAALDDEHKDLNNPAEYPVRISRGLLAAQSEAEARIRNPKS